MKKLFLLIVVLVVGVLPTSRAVSDSQTIDISGAANDLVVNYDYPANAASGENFDVSVNAFASTTGLTVTINGGSAWTYSGCSFVSETTAGTLTGIKSARVRISMDSATCSATATVSVTLTVGGALESQAYITMNVFQPSTTTAITSWPTLGIVNFNCGASGTTVAGLGSSVCLNPQTDNIVRLCAASTWGATCTAPTLNVVNSGSQSIALSGSINVANSGTQHILIDSWPTLISTVTNSGTLNIQNSAGQTFALSGTVNTPTTGSLTVTNAGGQSISVTSWPQLNAVLSGTVLECSTAALTADANACREDSSTTLIGNSTTIVSSDNTIHFPEFFSYIPLMIAFGLLFAGEKRKDNIYKAASGLFFIYSGIFLPLPADTRIVVLGVGLYLCLHYFFAGEARGNTDKE